MVDGSANLAAALLSTAAEHPRRPALKSFDEERSFGELLVATTKVADLLRGSGVAPSAHVGIALQGMDFVEAYLAVLSLGAVAVPLNPRSPAFELGSNLDRTQTRVLLTGPRLGPQGALDTVTAKDAALKGIECIEYGPLRQEALSGPGKTGEVKSKGEGMSLSPGDARDLLAGLYSPAAGDPAVLIMTGGTSGEPRAAVLTHRCMLANLRQLHTHPGTKARDGDVALGILPLFHIFGLNVVLGYSLYSGSCVAFPFEGRSETGGADSQRSTTGPEVWAAAIRRLGVSVVQGSPNMYRAMLEAHIPRDTFSSVRVCTSGASTLSGELFDAFASEYGLPLWEGYGMTEASPVITSSRLLEEPIKGCVGPPLPGIDLELRDEDGEPVEGDDHGEVYVKGENVFAGYYRDPAATTEALSGGWLRTGDIGVLDEGGRLYLVDRSKDVVIVGGFNVYPAEVESSLAAHEHVAEAAVIGEKSTDDERLVAFVVPARDVAGESADTLKKVLGDYLSSRLSRYKVPKDIRIVAEIPKTALDKIRRRALRQATTNSV